MPFEGEPPAQAEALAAVLEHLAGRRSGALIQGIGEPWVGQAHREILSRERTLFVVAERGPFAPLVTTRRVVVLRRGEAEAVHEILGPFYATELFLLIDRAGKRAVALWDATWTGGALRLDRGEDGWRVAGTSFWIA